MIAIADAGPLLALAKVKALGLLSELYRQAITSPAVFTEAVTAGLAQNAPDAKLLNAAFTSDQLQVRVPTLLSLPVPFLVHQGEGESICLAIELGADWLLMDDFDARRAALANFSAAGVSTRVKGTLGVIVTAYQHECLTRRQAIDLVNAIKARPDVWVSNALCDHVIHTLQTN
jgi:predicted nucleic acid-binding protein